MILSIREAAEADILRQVERYAAQGLPKIARRFHAAIQSAFDEYWISYLVQSDPLDVVRVLHGKRDVGASWQKFNDRLRMARRRAWA